MSDQGVECSTNLQIKEEITGSYKKLFTTSSSNNWDEALVGLKGCITSLMNQRFTRPVEIKKTLFAMHLHKVPGPNNMTPLFFQKC